MPFAPYLYHWRYEDHDDSSSSHNFNQQQVLRGSYFLSRDLQQQQNQHHEELHPWTVILCALLVLLLCWCSKPNIPDARFRRPRSYWTTARDRKIQRSLHIRQVVAVDATSGNLQLGSVAAVAAAPSTAVVVVTQRRPTDIDDDDDDNDGIEESADSATTLSSHNDDTADHNNNNPTSNNVREELVVIVLPDTEDMNDNDDDNDDTAAGCSICLEPYRVGDVVAWTARPPQQEDDTACLHVFHHACILEWLANPKKNDCPTCRAKILWDRSEEENDEEEDDKGDDDDDGNENEDNHDGSVNSSVFCVMHGLIARARRTSNKFMGSSDAMVVRDAAAAAASQIPLSQPSPLRRAHTVCATGRNGNVLLFQQQQQQQQRASLLLRRRRRRTEWCWTEPTSLRRVASAGPSTPVRSNTSCSTYNNNNSISSGLYQRTASRTFGVTADDDNVDDDDCAGLDLPVLLSSSSTGAPSNSFLPQSISLSRSASLGCQQLSASDDSVRLLRRNTTTSTTATTTNINANSNSVHSAPSVSEPITNTDRVLRNMVRMRHSISWGSPDTFNDVGDDEDDDVDRTDEDDIFLYRTTAAR